jgi:WD40 repeat protein
MSAERALLIRTAVNPESGRYFAVGMDVPSVRVFDTATGDLCSLVEPDKTKFSNASVLRSAGALTGTAFAVSLSCISMQEAHSQNTKSDVVLAAGLSDGTLLLHNVTRDALIGHIAISDSKQGVVSVAISNGLCLVLTRGGKVFIVDIDTVNVVAGPFDCPKNASSIAIADSIIHANTSGKKKQRDAQLVLVAGPTSSIFRLVSTGAQQYTFETACSFATQATPVNYSWMSPDGNTAVTCGAQEGVVRVWDLALEGSRPTAVCKRILPAGHRVGHLRVHQDDGNAVIAVTTFLGQVLLWDLGATLAPRVTDPMPLEPSATCVSATAPGKLLLGDINPATKQLITIRGRFAVPRFESRDVSVILQEAAASSTKTASLPLQSHGTQADDATAGTFAVDVDNEWASHHAVATRALVTAAEDFTVPKAYHADSVAQLPAASSLSLEAQQSRQGGPIVGVSLGSVTVPLYQALHAGDESLVMELMSVSSRSETEVAACIASLQLPYVLHLLKILSKRVQATSARSPVYQWVSAIIQLRGAEMYAAQQQKQDENLQQQKQSEEGDSPKTFVAPLLAHYRSMTSQYDKLAMAYGRLSIFRSVNPLEDRHGKKKRNIVAPEHAVADGIVFPKMFTLIDGDATRGGAKIVRMRSKLERAALEARRKRGSKKARVEGGDEMEDDVDDLDLSDDDDMSLNSEEMDAMLEDGQLSLGKPKRAKLDGDENLIAEDEEGSDAEDRSEDFDDMSDDLVDSDEESEGSASEVDSSPFEEEEDAEVASGEDDGDDSDEEDSDDGKEGGADDEEDANYSLSTRRSQNERRLRTD